MAAPPEPGSTATVTDGFQTAELLVPIAIGLGYRVPDDVSIVSLAGENFSFNSGRRIGSIDGDHEGMGEHAASLLLNALNGEPPQRIVLDVQLNERDSVAAPRLSAVQHV